MVHLTVKPLERRACPASFPIRWPISALRGRIPWQTEADGHVHRPPVRAVSHFGCCAQRHEPRGRRAAPGIALAGLPAMSSRQRPHMPTGSRSTGCTHLRPWAIGPFGRPACRGAVHLGGRRLRGNGFETAVRDLVRGWLGPDRCSDSRLRLYGRGAKQRAGQKCRSCPVAVTPACACSQADPPRAWAIRTC